MKINQTEGLEIHWNLKELLQKKHMGRPADFQTLLKENGLDLAYSAVYSLVHKQPLRIPMRTILIIVKLLGCDVNELIVIRKIGDKKAEARKSEPPKVKKVTKIEEHRRKITGPRIKFD